MFWIWVAVGFIVALCILFMFMFTAGAPRPDPDYDTVIVPTECEGVFIEVEYAGDRDYRYDVGHGEIPPEPCAPEVPPFVQAEYENYMNWRYTYPEGYYNVLIPLGRWYVHGIGEAPALIIDPMMKQAAIDSYDIYCCQTFVRLSGFPNSPYTILENAQHLIVTCRERGRSWCVALAICREESTWGMNPRARNDFGVCDPGIDMSDPVSGYCDFLDRHCGQQDEMSWILRGGYNPSSDYHNNILRLSQGIRGEGY
jgi:hypothetical protein